MCIDRFGHNKVSGFGNGRFHYVGLQMKRVRRSSVSLFNEYFSRLSGKFISISAIKISVTVGRSESFPPRNTAVNGKSVSKTFIKISPQKALSSYFMELIFD